MADTLCDARNGLRPHGVFNGPAPIARCDKHNLDNPDGPNSQAEARFILSIYSSIPPNGRENKACVGLYEWGGCGNKYGINNAGVK